ncbi:MAG TPA: hypothetical protein VJG83_05555 [archaeon]|nr:hypothetical protein [archaeon]
MVSRPVPKKVRRKEPYFLRYKRNKRIDEFRRQAKSTLGVGAKPGGKKVKLSQSKARAVRRLIQKRKLEAQDKAHREHMRQFRQKNPRQKESENKTLVRDDRQDIARQRGFEAAARRRELESLDSTDLWMRGFGLARRLSLLDPLRSELKIPYPDTAAQKERLIDRIIQAERKLAERKLRE